MSKSVEIALFKFADYADEPKTLEECRAIVEDEFYPWMAAESNGKLTFASAGLTDWQTLPQNMTFYGPAPEDPGGAGPFLSMAAASPTLSDHAMAMLPFTLQSRDLVILVFNRGRGAGSGVPKILMGCWPGFVGLDLPTLRHEGGHVLGHLYEAGLWQVPPGSNLHVCKNVTNMNADGCAWNRYADAWDAMGAGGEVTRHYSTYNRAVFGWQLPENITEARVSRPVTLWRADVPPIPGQSASQVQELRVPWTAAGPYFYTIEYRPSIGVLVRLVDPRDPPVVSGVSTFVVNRGRPLLVGQAFRDFFRDIHIQFVAAAPDYSYATIQVTRAAISGGGGGGGGVIIPD